MAENAGRMVKLICHPKSSMKLLWLVVVGVIGMINWYYIQSFHAVATQLRDLRNTLSHTGVHALSRVDPILQMQQDFTSAYSAVNSALRAT